MGSAPKTVMVLLVTSVLISGGHAQAQVAGEAPPDLARGTYARPKSIPMRALPDINLDSWMRALTEHQPAEPSLSISDLELSRRVQALAVKTRSHRELYQKLLELKLQLSLRAPKNILALADALFDARVVARENSHTDLADRYARITLLEYLAEELLYVGSLKFPRQIRDYVRSFSDLPNERLRLERTGDMRGIRIASGDIVLSKFSGTGSSSFIALTSLRPGLFSHSAIVYVDPSSGELLTPEAFIEDGVKLRSMQESYFDGSKTRTFVYRASGYSLNGAPRSALATQKAAAKGVENFVAEMKSRVSNPARDAAYAYNFTMDPARSGESYTCVETVLSSYERGGITGVENPYAPSVWSQFDPTHGPVFQEFLEMKAPSFPAPGDLDLNPSYSLAGLRLELAKLGQERVEMAAMDALFVLVAQNRNGIRDYLKIFDDVGEKQITAEQIEYLRSLEFLPHELRETIATHVPPHINLKQLIFFAYLNQVFTPNVRTAILNEAKVFETSYGRPAGLNELRGIAAKSVVEHLVAIQKIAQEFASARRFNR